MNKIKILIADDHKIVRMGLRALLSSEKDMTVVGEADDGDAAAKASVALKPDVVIMDLMMPVMSGEDAIAELHRLQPSVRAIVLTSFSSSDRIVQALNAGATGAVLKTADDATLLKAVRTVSRGGKFISPEIRKLISADPPVKKLSPRQQEVLESLTQGLSNKDIAAKLGISNPRVEELMVSLLSKIGAANRTEAVAIAMRKHLLKI